MRNITFNLSTLHTHGPAFFDYLRLRKHFFVDVLGWDIPHDGSVEMDQYDNPTAFYSLVLRNGRVVGGARTMATTARWGKHTYMLKDAFDGMLEDIPPGVMPECVVNDRTWECTRLVVSDELTGAAERGLCLQLIVDGLVRTANAHGGAELMSLSPITLVRALRQLGYQARRVGEPYTNPGDRRTYAVLAMPAEPVMALMAAE
jgi:N-acyl-L-homoserine lactone synthetase